MEGMIAYCGINCTECPARITTQAKDAVAAQAIADQWSKAYNIKVMVDNIWCDGCLVEGKKCAHCHECEIRACGMGKGVANCAHCADYPCDQLNKFFTLAPGVKKNLDEIKQNL